MLTDISRSFKEELSQPKLSPYGMNKDNRLCLFQLPYMGERSAR